jgi:GDP-mannose 6-dehydrogenase
MAEIIENDSSPKGISIFGLGYVGCVGAGCLAAQGYHVYGVDTVEAKVSCVARGEPTVVEPGLAELIREGSSRGMISATTDLEKAVAETDLGFICVGTPSGPNGHLDLSGIYSVADSIGRALRARNAFFTIIIRSTVFPGTNRRVAEIISAASGKKDGIDFAVVSNPEFLREGTAIEDYLKPQISVIGSYCERASREVAKLYSGLETSVRIVAVEVAEIIKYVNNAYHALKVTFANEVGSICKEAGIDAHDVMELFCEDKRLNISKAYLMPGFAYGGSCLPKDLKGLVSLAHDYYLETPVLASIDRSNAAHKEAGFQAILDTGKTRIGFLGLSFKEDTDDLRNSPAVELIEKLIGKGFWILIYDKNVHLSQLMGANKAEIERRIPKIQSFVTDSLQEVIDKTDVLVLSQRGPGLSDIVKSHPDKLFIDLIRIDRSLRSGGNYVGMAW